MVVYCFCLGVGCFIEMDFEFNICVNIFYKYLFNIYLVFFLLVFYNCYGYDWNNFLLEIEDWNI